MAELLDDPSLARRIFDHIDQGSTDLADGCWREPVANYLGGERLRREVETVLRRTPTPFCPSAALAEPGSFVAREAAGVPLLAVRGSDGTVRAFRNACRHRGAQVAEGSGRRSAFVCRYHGWTYGLDGALRSVPHEHGFPELNKCERGLVPVHTREAGGLVFVTQNPPEGGVSDPDVPDLLGPELRLVSVNEHLTPVNWKIIAEGMLEGYHIRFTHRTTFYPAQFDNLNVIEYFGRNSRVTFPYRNVEKLRPLPARERDLAGTVTHVYHLFPNVAIATFPRRVLLLVLEPVDPGLTRQISYVLAEGSVVATDQEGLQKDTSFVNAGTAEDLEVIESIQRSLASGANEYFEFGRFEGAIGHFHRNLHEALR